MDIVVVILIISFTFFVIRVINEKMDDKEIKVEEIIIDTIDDNLTAKLTEDYLTLSNYIGQSKNIDYLMGHIKRAKKLGKPIGHIILWGNGGLGKSTLIKATSFEMGGRFIELVPANLRSVKDLFSVMFKKVCPDCNYLNPFSTNRCIRCKKDISVYFTPELMIKDNDIIFLEECHRLKNDIEEALYSLMQDEYIMIRYNGVDQRVTFPPITIAGATTRLGDLNKPFRDRFKIDILLEPYKEKEISLITKMYCEHHKIEITNEALEMVSKLSFGIPRIAKTYIDDAVTRNESINKDTIIELLSLSETDNYGLNKIHRKILDYIHIRGQAGTVAIAGSVGLSKNIYEEVYEPALMYKELVFLGPRGRILTNKAKKIYYNGCKCDKCK